MTNKGWLDENHNDKHLEILASKLLKKKSILYNIEICITTLTSGTSFVKAPASWRNDGKDTRLTAANIKLGQLLYLGWRSGNVYICQMFWLQKLRNDRIFPCCQPPPRIGEYCKPTNQTRSVYYSDRIFNNIIPLKSDNPNISDKSQRRFHINTAAAAYLPFNVSRVMSDLWYLRSWENHTVPTKFSYNFSTAVRI